MSITDELRDWVLNHYTGWQSKQAEGLAIADRIDEEHGRAVRQARADAFGERYVNIDSWLSQNEREMAKHGWVKLPVDADGMPIHIGDEMRADSEPRYSKHKVVGIELRESGGWSIDLLGYGLSALRPECSYHHRTTTVEDVLNEMLDAFCSNDIRTPCQLVADYAKRLTLKEDA